MKVFTDEELQAMSREEAKAHVRNTVYEATDLIERLQRAGKIYGNGHHIRQELAELAKAKLGEIWKGGEE